MEHLDDKNIRNKIDLLDSLPAGYEPSLQSKWELLENALPEKKNNNRKFILAIAASIILLLGFGGLFIKTTLEQQPDIVFQDVKAVKKTNEITLPEVDNFASTENTGLLSGNIVRSENTSRKIENSITETNPEIAFTTIKDSVSESVIPEVILTENNLVATSPKTKKSKKRFVEIDFNEVEITQPEPETKLAGNKIKFKVNILKTRQKTTGETQPATVLKLSKEFPLNN